MKKRVLLALALVLALLLTSAGCADSANEAGSASTPPASPASADGSEGGSTSGWPGQPVNVICPAAAGGGTDMVLRIVNEYFTKETGQSLVINNVTGITGYEMTYQGNTDGYDFILGTTTIFTSKIDGTLDYDWADYEMVAFIEGDSTTCIAVQSDSPYQSVNDLLDAARADPESVIGGIVLSGQPYMFAKALKEAVDIDLYYVDCGTTAERNASLLGGQVDYIITNVMASQAYEESGDFRFLAIDGDERYELTPDLPTFKEQGIDFSFSAQHMVWLAPKGTPAEACEAFNAVLKDIYANPDFYDDMLGIQMIAKPVPPIEESIGLGQDYADLLAPYAV